MSMSPTLDTAGLLSKDPVLWKAAAQAMYKENITFSTSYPTKVATLSWPTEADTVANALLINFLANVTSFLKANATAFNISAAWQEQNLSTESLESYLNLTYPVLITQEQIPLVRDPFYRDYAAKHDGRRPFVDPVPLVRWAWGETTTETLENAYTNKTTFMSWINSTLLVPNAKTCSDSLLLYVGRDGSETTCRNTCLKEPRPPFGFSERSISILSETPDFVVPVGEAPYHSTVTGHVEYLPVAVDFMAAKGCDGMLFSLIGELYEAGIVKRARAGQSGVTGREILFRRNGGDE